MWGWTRRCDAVLSWIAPIAITAIGLLVALVVTAVIRQC